MTKSDKQYYVPKVVTGIKLVNREDVGSHEFAENSPLRMGSRKPTNGKHVKIFLFDYIRNRPARKG